jgi:hypothetical protein
MASGGLFFDKVRLRIYLVYIGELRFFLFYLHLGGATISLFDPRALLARWRA